MPILLYMFNPVVTSLQGLQQASDFTSAQDRIIDLKSAEEVSTLEEAPSSGLSATFSPDAGEKGLDDEVQDNRIEHGKRAGWLAPIELKGFSVFGVQCSVFSFQRIAERKDERLTKAVY